MAALLAAAAVLLFAGGEVTRLRVRTRLAGHGSSGAWQIPTVPVPRWAGSALQRAGITDAATALTAWTIGAGLCAVAAPVVPQARVLLVATLLGPPAALAVVGDRHGRMRGRQLPEALDAVATALRGGASLPAAVQSAAGVGAPLGAELHALSESVAAGRPLDEALDRWAAAAGDTATGLAAAALTVAARVGGPGARAVDGASASLRDRLDADAEAASLATQGRASALVLTLAPVAFAVLLSGVDPRAGHFLLGSPAGWACVTVGVGLDAVGAWWMGRLVRSAR